MIGYEVYKLVHLVAMFALFVAVGGTSVHAANRGTKENNVVRGALAALHGIALLMILVGGFGMLARLGVKHDWLFPFWLWVKLAVWLLFAFALALPSRKPALAKPMLLLAPLVGGIAALMALFKPF